MKRENNAMNRDICETDIPCICGETKLIIETGFVGFIGNKPCYEDYGECPSCGMKLNQSNINKRYRNLIGSEGK
jgi:hypothetical protein